MNEIAKRHRGRFTFASPRRIAARLCLSALLLSSACFFSGPPTYYQDAITVRVVDRETKKPLEGVGVLATWEYWDTIGTNGGKLLRVADAVTDKDGRFRLEGWGPLARNPRYVLWQKDPHLLLIRAGYLPLHLDNELLSHDDPDNAAYEIAELNTPQKKYPRFYAPLEYPPGPKRECYWNGKTVGLKRPKNLEEEAAELDFQLSWRPDDEREFSDSVDVFWKPFFRAVDSLPENLRSRVHLSGLAAKAKERQK